MVVVDTNIGNQPSWRLGSLCHNARAGYGGRAALGVESRTVCWAVAVLRVFRAAGKASERDMWTMLKTAANATPFSAAFPQVR